MPLVADFNPRQLELNIRQVGERAVTIPVEEQYASAATGRVKVQYVEPSENGPLTIAETDAVLN